MTWSTAGCPGSSGSDKDRSATIHLDVPFPFLDQSLTPDTASRHDYVSYIIDEKGYARPSAQG